MTTATTIVPQLLKYHVHEYWRYYCLSLIQTVIIKVNTTGPQEVDVLVELFTNRLQVRRPQQIRLSTTAAVL